MPEISCTFSGVYSATRRLSSEKNRRQANPLAVLERDFGIRVERVITGRFEGALGHLHKFAVCAVDCVELLRVAAFAQVRVAKELTGVFAHQNRRVGLLLDEVGVDPSVVDQDLAHAKP